MLLVTTDIQQVTKRIFLLPILTFSKHYFRKKTSTFDLLFQKSEKKGCFFNPLKRVQSPLGVWECFPSVTNTRIVLITNKLGVTSICYKQKTGLFNISIFFLTVTTKNICIYQKYFLPLYYENRIKRPICDNTQ